MDLEIVGRHALLFDDDATAEVVNSGGSLVPWAAVGAADLLLDRHDVRHLLDRVPARPRRAYSAALLSVPSPDGISEAELDRERFLDLPSAGGEGEGEGKGTRDASPSGNGTDSGRAGYNAVCFSYGSSAGSDDPNSQSSYYRPSFHVPEMYLDVRNRQPPSEKVHQIIARTALFVSEHGGQSEIVLRVKQGNNPTFGFLMPDHHLHSYFRYIVDHPQLVKDGVDAVDTNKGYKTANIESEHALSGGALSLLGTVYESGDEDEGTLLDGSNGMNPDNRASPEVQGCTSDIHANKEVVKAHSTAAVKDKPILAKKNPMLTRNSVVPALRQKVEDTDTTLSNVKSENSNSGVSEIKEMILEPPSFLKQTMDKIVEFIIRNGKEFEGKLIEQDRATGRFPFLLSSNPYHLYYLKMLQEYQESKSRPRSSEHKERRSSERNYRSSSERKDSNSSKEATRSKTRGTNSGMDSAASDRSSAEPSEKQCGQLAKSNFQLVDGGVKKEPPRKVTADEAAAIVMAATRGLRPSDDSHDSLKEMRVSVHTRGNNDHSSSFGSASSLQDRDAMSKHTSNSEADNSLTNSGQLKKEVTGIIDDDWIAKTIAKAAAVAASKEVDSSEASMTKEQKLKAERLRRAKMFAAIIKSGGNKTNDLATVTDPANELAKGSADMDVSAPDLQPATKEREGSSVPFEREGSNSTKQERHSDDEQNRVRKYRTKHHIESDDEKDDSGESYKHSRKRHRSEHSGGHSKDVHKHKHRSHSGDRESKYHRHEHSSLQDDHEHRGSKSRRHRHKDDKHYSDDGEHRRSHRHRHSSKRKHDDDEDLSEETLGCSAASPSTSDVKFKSEKTPLDTAQSSQEVTDVPSDLRAKIRAMLRENL